MTFQMKRSGGYTLMEMMVTLTLAAVLMGMGAGAFMGLGKNTAYRQVLSDAAGLVNKARNASIRFPAAIVADPAERLLYGRTEQMLQELHFEPKPAGEDDEGELDVADGIGGLEVQYLGGELIPGGGRVGGGMKFAGGGIDCGDYVAYDVEDGLSLEVWVQLENAASVTLFEKGKAFTVRLIAANSGPGRIKVTLGVSDEGNREEVGTTVEIPRVKLGKWIGVLVSYDRNKLTVSTDNGFGPVVRGEPLAETRPLLPDTDAPLRVASDLVGMIDDVRFGGVIVEDPITMPSGVELDGPARTIYFRAGKLDGRMHAGIEELRLRGEGKVTVLQIGRSGTVQDLFEEAIGADDVLNEAVPDDGSGGGEKEE